eukprot:1217704-Rhodomonas_salina.4
MLTQRMVLPGENEAISLRQHAYFPGLCLETCGTHRAYGTRCLRYTMSGATVANTAKSTP